MLYKKEVFQIAYLGWKAVVPSDLACFSKLSGDCYLTQFRMREKCPQHGTSGLYSLAGPRRDYKINLERSNLSGIHGYIKRD